MKRGAKVNLQLSFVVWNLSIDIYFFSRVIGLGRGDIGSRTVELVVWSSEPFSELLRCVRFPMPAGRSTSSGGVGVGLWGGGIR